MNLGLVEPDAVEPTVFQLLCSGHIGVVGNTVHLAGGWAIHDSRLPRQPGRAGGGRADGLSTQGHDNGLILEGTGGEEAVINLLLLCLSCGRLK